VYIRSFALTTVLLIELLGSQLSSGEDMAQKGFTLWFTGLSGAGKTTLARLIEAELQARGHKVEVLDGDIIRTNLSKGLGYSKEDRDTNIRRIGFVCNLLTRNDVIAIAAAISPYREVRDEVRRNIGSFVEVYVKCPIDVLSERDVKGLYKKALAGEIKNFTGVDDPYEAPLAAEVIVETDLETPEQSVVRIISKLEEMTLVAAAEPVGYSEEDEEEVRRRLEALGYV
jgi:adenylyl-sulfate kinase